EEALLAAWLRDARSVLGPDDPFIHAALGNSEPEAVARKAVRGTALIDLEFRKKLLASKDNDLSSVNDPMIELARAVEPIIRELRIWNERNII
ncbi:S46 family peptidase, partial [Escherichia coli]|nr:S46 family peptidase [Escherichia coli]